MVDALDTASYGLLPPQDLAAEMSVLGACAVDAGSLDRCMDILEPQHFYRIAHSMIWRCMRALHLRGEAVDSVTIAQELRRAEFEEQAGGFDYIAECIDRTPRATNSEWYARAVREKWLRRQLIKIANEMSAAAFDESVSVQQTIESVCGQAIALQVRESSVQSLEHVKHTMLELTERLQQGPLRTTNRLRTGIESLDNMIGGFQNSDLHYWGGAPGSGKTTLAMQSAFRVASADHLVVFISMELGRVQFARRMATFASRVDGRTIEYGPKSKLALSMERINTGIDRIKGLPLFVAFGSLSTAHILSRLRQLIAVEKKKPSVVFIDRLEMLADNDCSSVEETKRIPILSPRVKAIATSLDVPVVCLAQLNRAGRQGDPSAESFRASGSIEQDCQVGLIVKTEKERSRSTLWVVKQNDGETGPCREMMFNASLPMFIEIEA